MHAWILAGACSDFRREQTKDEPVFVCAPDRTVAAEETGARAFNGALIDKNARIGDGVVITPEGKPENVDGNNYYIRDGVVVVPKGAVIPAGTSI
jgi:UDP-3-O-[3-hydroxymyristoyl] glucosamine N-acyltransferase